MSKPTALVLGYSHNHTYGHSKFAEIEAKRTEVQTEAKRTDVYLGHYQTSTIEFSCKKIHQLLSANYFI